MKRKIKKIVESLSEIDEIKIIILYGSFARQEGTTRSDIDLLILTSKKNAENKIQNKIIELESTIERTIQPTIRTIDELQKTDTGLMQNIFKEGKVLYLREPADIPSALLLKQKPYLIYSFRINNLNQRDKVRFNRSLYEQARKEYKYQGLLKEIGGEKLASGCLIVPQTQKAKIESFFKKFKVIFEVLKIWK